MKKQLRVAKHQRVRKNMSGSADRPRLSVFRSSQHIYAQIIDDQKGVTLASMSDLKLTGRKSDKASQVGEELAKKAVALKISKVVFDRGGYKYQGRVIALAEGARKGGLDF